MVAFVFSNKSVSSPYILDLRQPIRARRLRTAINRKNRSLYSLSHIHLYLSIWPLSIIEYRNSISTNWQKKKCFHYINSHRQTFESSIEFSFVSTSSHKTPFTQSNHNKARGEPRRRYVFLRSGSHRDAICEYVGFYFDFQNHGSDQFWKNRVRSSHEGETASGCDRETLRRDAICLIKSTRLFCECSLSCFFSRLNSNNLRDRHFEKNILHRIFVSPPFNLLYYCDHCVLHSKILFLFFFLFI